MTHFIINQTPGTSVSEVRAKPAVVGIESKSKASSSELPYEPITQQITYLMSTITNQNANNNGQNGPRHNNGNGKFLNTRTQRPNKDRKDMIYWGWGGTGHGWRGCSTPRQGNNVNSPFHTGQLNFKWLMREGNTDFQSPPSPNQGKVNINRQLRTAGVFIGPDYYNPNPWVRLLGRANESEIEIDGIISKALIDSGEMISIMTKEYYDKHRYEIQPLDQLVPIEGSGGADVPYLGYVKVKIQIPSISSFEQDVFMLMSHTTTHYHKEVPFQVGSRIIDQVVKT